MENRTESHISLTFRAAGQRGDLWDRLSTVVATSPFTLGQLEALDATTWSVRLLPASDRVVVSFAKFAELLVLLSKEVDIVAFDRMPAREMAAAS